MLSFFFGEDSYTQLEMIKSLREDFFKQNPAGDFQEVQVSADTTDADLVSQFTAFQSQGGLFSTASFLLVSDLVSQIKKFPKTEEQIFDLLDSGLPEEKTLILSEMGSVDRRLKLYKKLIEKATVKEFSVPEQKELATWIKQRLTTEGFEIDNDALSRFVSLVTGESPEETLYDVWQLQSEINKLVLYKFDEKHISQTDVELLVKPNVTENVFAMTNLFAEGKTGEAINLLEQMVGQVQPNEIKSRAILIVGALAGQLRSLLMVKSLEKNSQEKIAEILGWKPGRVWINQKLAKKFTTDKLVALIGDLQKIDRRLKSSEESPRLLLELFVQRAKP